MTATVAPSEMCVHDEVTDGCSICADIAFRAHQYRTAYFMFDSDYLNYRVPDFPRYRPNTNPWRHAYVRAMHLRRAGNEAGAVAATWGTR